MLTWVLAKCDVGINTPWTAVSKARPRLIYHRSRSAHSPVDMQNRQVPKTAPSKRHQTVTWTHYHMLNFRENLQRFEFFHFCRIYVFLQLPRAFFIRQWAPLHQVVSHRLGQVQTQQNWIHGKNTCSTSLLTEATPAAGKGSWQKL